MLALLVPREVGAIALLPFRTAIFIRFLLLSEYLRHRSVGIAQLFLALIYVGLKFLANTGPLFPDRTDEMFRGGSDQGGGCRRASEVGRAYVGEHGLYLTWLLLVELDIARNYYFPLSLSTIDFVM